MKIHCKLVTLRCWRWFCTGCKFQLTHSYIGHPPTGERKFQTNLNISLEPFPSDNRTNQATRSKKQNVLCVSLSTMVILPCMLAHF